MIAGLVETLEDAGQLANTYIIYTSDNGYEFGDHRIRKGKQTPYEESARVSLVVRGPGVQRGRTLDHLLVNTDLAPTLAELGIARELAPADGRSFVPLLGSSPPPASEWRQSVLLEIAGSKGGKKDDEDPKSPAFAGLRMNGAVYIEYETGERELYDLVADPHQANNLINGASSATLEAYAGALASLRTCRAESCRLAEDAPLPAGR